MSRFANQKYFDDPASLAAARKGIVAPQLVELDAGLLFRFGSDAGNAMTGGWWLDLAGWNLVHEFAVLNGLSVPHAARVLSAVEHYWGGSRTPDQFNMRALVRAAIAAPLLAWQGESAPQAHGAEMIAPPTTVNGRAFLQLNIPGLWDPAVNGRALAFGGLVDWHAEGDSHIFGMPGAPAGMMLN